MDHRSQPRTGYNSVERWALDRAGQNTMPSTTGNDELFCHELAKRSVARAALHLGVDTMSEDALNVMGDVLTTYLEKFGRALSLIVESSGRSSAHANVLDAFHAVQECTSYSVLQMHPQPPQQQDQAATSNGHANPSIHPTRRQLDQLNQPAWQELARFVFGPNWYQDELRRRATGDTAEEVAYLGQGKKMLHSQKKDTKHGWNAPYLDEVPVFPEASGNCANPHKLPASIAASLHPTRSGVVVAAAEDNPDLKTAASLAEKVEENVSQQLQSLDDRVFITSTWGEVQTVETKGKRAREDEEDTDAPPTKRTRFESTESAGELAKTKEVPVISKAESTRPTYIPRFFPALPQTKSGGTGRTIIDSESLSKARQLQSNNDEGSVGVRSALVKMESHYWGSGWDADAPTSASLEVPLGLVQTSSKDEPAVVPLLRASGSRASRILEGSMDPFQ